MERSARSRYERLSHPTGTDDAAVLKAAEDLWLEASAALVVHEETYNHALSRRQSQVSRLFSMPAKK